MTRGYDQYCPVARALDEIGDRWTLLILRELNGVGEQRFTDLKRNLPGIPPTVLTARLRDMIARGLVTTRALPPPAARTVYAATPRGRETIPVLRALARWGLPLLEPPPEDLPLRPATVVNAALLAWYDRAAALGVDESYLVELDGETFTLRVGAGSAEPAMTLRAPARALVEARLGRTKLGDDPRVSRSGTARSWKTFQRVYQIA
jgi:DNA-binding HxlR family transcriptional regulator